jgi:hypothetical protein
MKKVLSRALTLPVLLAAMLALTACNKSKEAEQSNQGPPGGGPRFGPGMGGPPSPIRDIMVKLAKGPQSLTSQVGQELQADPPEWDKVQFQMKEYTELVQSMAKHDPPRGDKESWAKMTGSFAEAASALQKAVLAKDKEGAAAAQKNIAKTCTSCHLQHRSGPGGMGGFGPPGQGFGPPGKNGGFPPDGGKAFGPPGKEGGFPTPGKDGAKRQRRRARSREFPHDTSGVAVPVARRDGWWIAARVRAEVLDTRR